MSTNSHIEWTDATWNPVTGCTKVSPGCDNCYIERTPPFRMQGRRFDRPGIGGTTGVKLYSDRLHLPRTWAKPRRVFVNSLSDLFHDQVTDQFIAELWSVMARCPQHVFQILTKRPARARALLNRPSFRDNLSHWGMPWPLPNVWYGVSVEDQDRAALRLDALTETPAAVLWVSCEPLLGPLDLSQWLVDHGQVDRRWGIPLDWVVVGGESGPGARPMNPAWARSLRDQCAAAQVPFFFKQWGEFLPALPPSTTPVRVGKKSAGRELDGRTWDEYPRAVTA